MVIGEGIHVVTEDTPRNEVRRCDWDICDSVQFRECNKILGSLIACVHVFLERWP